MAYGYLRGDIVDTSGVKKGKKLIEVIDRSQKKTIFVYIYFEICMYMNEYNIHIYTALVKLTYSGKHHKAFSINAVNSI